MGDDYAAPTYRWMNTPAGGPPVVVKPDWTSGATPNHCEQQLAAWAGQHLPSVSDLIVQWYGDVKLVGDQAKGGTDEALFSKSHWGHFGAARGPLLFFGMRAGDQRVVQALTKSWQGNLVAARLLALPDWSLVTGLGARFSDDSDQRKQVTTTFAWLDHGAEPALAKRPIRLPKMIETSPDWLGLYALMQIETAWKRGETWAKAWPTILSEIRSGTAGDLLPLKNQLVLERGPKGHVAHFETVDKMGQPSPWVCADYASGVVTYGLPEGVAPPNAKQQITTAYGTPPACPGGPGRITRWPKAGGR